MLWGDMQLLYLSGVQTLLCVFQLLPFQSFNQMSGQKQVKRNLDSARKEWKNDMPHTHMADTHLYNNVNTTSSHQQVSVALAAADSFMLLRRLLSFSLKSSGDAINLHRSICLISLFVSQSLTCVRIWMRLQGDIYKTGTEYDLHLRDLILDRYGQCQAERLASSLSLIPSVALLSSWQVGYHHQVE